MHFETLQIQFPEVGVDGMAEALMWIRSRSLQPNGHQLPEVFAQSIEVCPKFEAIFFFGNWGLNRYSDSPYGE